MDKEVTNISEQEADLIRGVFANNENLLKLIRALFLNLGITQEEKESIKGTFSSKPLRDVIWKRLYPTLSKDLPIGQVQDIWLGTEQMVFGATTDTIKQALGYKEKSLEMTKTALELLENPDGQSLDLSYDPERDPLGIDLLARNQFIRHVESQLAYLWLIASQKKLTPKEEAERLLKDSTK